MPEESLDVIIEEYRVDPTPAPSLPLSWAIHVIIPEHLNGLLPNHFKFVFPNLFIWFAIVFDFQGYTLYALFLSLITWSIRELEIIKPRTLVRKT